MNRETLDKLINLQNSFNRYEGRTPEKDTKYHGFLNTVKSNILAQLNKQILEQLDRIPQDREGSRAAHQMLIQPQVLKYTLGDEVRDLPEYTGNVRPEHTLRGIVSTGLSDFFAMLDIDQGVSVGTEIHDNGHTSIYLSFQYTTDKFMSILPNIISRHEQSIRDAEMYNMVKSIFDKLS